MTAEMAEETRRSSSALALGTTCCDMVLMLMLHVQKGLLGGALLPPRPHRREQHDGLVCIGVRLSSSQ
jgi:hypothetical protein